jgi:hypothetical protein
MIKQMPEFFYAVNVLVQWHGEKQEWEHSVILTAHR